MGRPSIYDEKIKPHLQEIREAVEAGATVEEIADMLGVNADTIYKYKREKTEFSEAFARGRAHIVINIKAALLKKALGFNYEETKQYITEAEEGEQSVRTEVTTKYSPPSETAAAMLLHNYSSDWIDKDRTTTELKKQDMELRKEIAESSKHNLDGEGEQMNLIIAEVLPREEPPEDE